MPLKTSGGKNQMMIMHVDPHVSELKTVDKKQHHRILVVDDESTIRQLLADCLSDDFRVLEASNGNQALSVMDRENPELIVLDIMMAGMDGFQVLHKIRENSAVPVVMLSARIDPVDKIKALKLGADDYVTKPFVIEELKARIKAILRRNAGNDRPRKIDFDDGYLRIDLTKQRVWVNGQGVELTAKELNLLLTLFINAGTVRNYHSLLKTIWGSEYGTEKESVQAVVKRLRHKIEPDPGNPQYILTVDNIGYRFKDI
jgi:DNA-binding response OmpR family regulator